MASYVAVLIGTASRDDELRHLAALCERLGVRAPDPPATHFSATLPDFAFKWERHGEFSGYTFFQRGVAEASFENSPIDSLPSSWLGRIPGHTIFAAHAVLTSEGERGQDHAQLLQHSFADNLVVGSEVGGGAGVIYTDFRTYPDGFARLLVVDRGFTERQAGRTLQRLFEIEAYRMLALLALPIARETAVAFVDLERSLANLITQISTDGRDDESILQELIRLSRDVEGAIVSTQFRFGGCAAYHQLVMTRIAELREVRLGGIQTIEEFMSRRFSPAVATVANTARRLQDLSMRVAQTFALLSTRVGITREKQNQALLESMDRRAQMQLRLQQTVEGLSVAAILYYMVGLVGYGAKALKAAGIRLEPDAIVGMSIVPLAALLVWGLGRARMRVARSTSAHSRHESRQAPRPD